MIENRKLRLKLQFDALAKSYKAGNMTTEEYQTGVDTLNGFMADLETSPLYTTN